MVTKPQLLTLLALTIVLTACASPMPCTTGSEFEPPLCPSHYNQIERLEITQNAATRHEQLHAESCADFVLTPDLVKQFFIAAKTTTDNDAHHTLDWSPCYATGTVVFRSGERGEWVINKQRLGHLMLANQTTITLYCPVCEFAPFEW